MQVEVYTIKNCHLCKEAKDYITEKGIKFREFDMGKGGNLELQEKKKYFKSIGLKTYPITIIDIKGIDWTITERFILQGFDKKEYDEVFGNE